MLASLSMKKSWISLRFTGKTRLTSSLARYTHPAFPFKRPFGAEPPKEFAFLRRSYPISKVGIVDGTAWAWLLTKHGDICEVLDDNVHFSKCRTRTNFPELTKGGKNAAAKNPTFVDMDPPQHTKFRGMSAPAFSLEKVNQMVPLIQETAEVNLKEMMKSSTKSADLVSSFALPMASQIIYRMLGIPLSDMKKLSEFNAIRTNGSSTATQASVANQKLLKYLTRLVEQKAASGSLHQDQDIISTLVREQFHTGSLKLEELVQMVFLLLVAGNATMVNMIALGVVTFLQHPDQLKQVIADSTLMPNAVRELCRLHTASALATRT